jgi:hypothetical protein
MHREKAGVGPKWRRLARGAGLERGMVAKVKMSQHRERIILMRTGNGSP